MHAFIVESENKPGELARQTKVLADRNVNVYPFCLAIGSRGAVAYLVNDETAARSALTDAGVGFRELETITIHLEDRPGTVAMASRRLADAGVNIELFTGFLNPDGKTATGIVGVDKVDAAKKALSDQLTDWEPASMSQSAAKATV